MRTLVIAIFTSLLASVCNASETLSSAEEANTPFALDVTIEKASTLVESQEVTVLDVRTPNEYKAGHIAGALSIDFRDDGFSKTIEELDKSEPYLVHCASGNRSRQAVDILKKAGFTKIYHFTGGMSSWMKNDRPVQK